MRISPFAEIFAVAALGAAGALGLDLLINGAGAGAMKAASLLSAAGLARPAALFCGALAVGAPGPLSVFYFRPLTKRGAFTLAFGIVAIMAMLTPALSVVRT
jgi:hypothetical protein